MHQSVLSRSVVAVASLAIGSVALAATPATAATPSGITRDQVLTAASSLRTISSQQEADAAYALMREIARPTCAIAPADVVYFSSDSRPVEEPSGVDGLIIKAYIEAGTGPTRTFRQCVAAAVAPTDAARTLAGTLTITGTTRVGFEPGDTGTPVEPIRAAMSGDVYVSPPLKVSGETYINDADFTAVGTASTSTKVLTLQKISDVKTRADRSAAKKKYVKRLAAAKRAYTKARQKAGGSAAKKAAAKRAYSDRRTVAKDKYAYGIADYKLAKRRTTQVDARTFSVRPSDFSPA